MALKTIIHHLSFKNIFQIITGTIFYLWYRIILKKMIYIIPSSRIGHLAGEMNLHQSNNITYDKNIYIYLTPICNDKFFEICTNGLDIRSDKKIKFFIVVIRKFDLLDKFFHKLTECADRDVLQLRSQTRNKILLSSQDCKLARSILEKNGYHKLLQKKVILLNVRDTEYLEKKFSNKDFGYHDYRNSDIKSYNKAVNYLLSKNFSVIRMGRETSSKQTIEDDLFWDYSHTSIRSDLLDIYLAEICYACISTGSGFDALTTINNKPILYVNFLPHSHCMSFAPTNYTSFKKLKDISSNKIIDNFDELYSRNVFSALSQQQFTDNGFEVVDLTEEEILNCTKNFIEQIKLRENATKRVESQYETSFKNIIKSRKSLSELHSQDPIVQLIGPNA